jgi:hypothetical protein
MIGFEVVDWREKRKTKMMTTEVTRTITIIIARRYQFLLKPDWFSDTISPSTDLAHDGYNYKL